MASLTRRTIILVISETLNYAVLFLSPIFLVRILDVNAYGQYKEFTVYSSLILAFVSFGIKSNLLFFISKNPKNEKEYVSNTIILLFIFSMAGILILYLAQPYIKEITSFDFVHLVIILIFFQQIDMLDIYWLAKKRSDYVLYWSSGNAIIRTSTIIIIAYLTHDILSIIYVMILMQILKGSYTLYYLKKKKIFTFKVNTFFLRKQLAYIIPIGIAGIILKFNIDISKVIISSSLGASALAIYVIGSQNLPLLNIVRKSVSNVIFPDIAERVTKDPREALSLWNRANVVYLFLMVPVFILMFYYSEIIITTLFTKDYLAAVPIFRIYLILLIRKCFEMGIPIRAMNKNKFFVYGNILSLCFNIVLLYSLFNLIGFLGPAIAAVLTEISLNVFLAAKIISIYNISLKELLLWKKIFRIFCVAVLSTPILLLEGFIDINPLVNAILFGSIYVLLYFSIFRLVRIDEVDSFMSKFLRKVKLSW